MFDEKMRFLRWFIQYFETFFGDVDIYIHIWYNL